jgi:integrase/recombinase XerD
VARGAGFGKMLDGEWLFPGLEPVDPLGTGQLNRSIHAIHAVAEAAYIDTRVSMRILRSVALAWLLQRSANILLIPGTSAIEHLRQNAAGAKLSHCLFDDIVELSKIGQ